jgi:protein O-GlcNAc transferase
MSTSDVDEKPTLREIKYEYTPLFPELLKHLQSSIILTTYQAGKLLVIGLDDKGALKLGYTNYDQPMGLAVHPRRIAVGTKREIRFFCPTQSDAQSRDGHRPSNNCLAERSSQVTGKILGHDLAWGDQGLWVVNTLFSCLCTLHDEFSFVPQWKPSFITELAGEDRCHLNGLAMENGQPRYVTALAPSNVAAGWRADRANTGIIIDVKSGATVCSGLAMPHSPRMRNGELYVLNSGWGSMGKVNPTNGQYTEIERAPGYTRGLAFYGQFAFVGLSRIRETSVFGGLPIAEKLDELCCGVGVIDIESGRTVAVLKFVTGVTEIFAVDVIPGMTMPQFAGSTIDDVEQELWIVPDNPL